MNLFICSFIYICFVSYISKYVYVCVYIYIYMYTYVYVYIYIYYIYIYMCVCVFAPSERNPTESPMSAEVWRDLLQV